MNQNPEQKARDRIDQMLLAAGWAIQSKPAIDFSASLGVAVREYTTSVGPADYVLFVDGKPIGIIEAKKEDEGYKMSVVEDQSEDYANSKLQYIKGKQPLPFIYESTGTITRFRDTRDPSPRSREVFAFYQADYPPEVAERRQYARGCRAGWRNRGLQHLPHPKLS